MKIYCIQLTPNLSEMSNKYCDFYKELFMGDVWLTVHRIIQIKMKIMDILILAHLFSHISTC